MGFRFRKKVKIFPGVSLNLGLGGVSTTIGVPGANLNIGKRGVSSTLGLPGTGLSYNKKLFGFGGQKTSVGYQLPTPAALTVDDTGKVYFLDTNNNTYDEETNKKLKQQYKQEVENAIREKEEQINLLTDKLLNVYKPLYPLIGYNRQPSMSGRYNVRDLMNGDISTMDNFLQEKLQEIDFPLETNVSYEIIDRNTVFLDVDLPEVEDIPLEKASVTASGKLSVKSKTKKEINQLYATVVCGIALKLSSFVFSVLPTCDTIIISGYTQRIDKSTGNEKDTYIYSLEINKNVLYSLNIDNIDVVLAMNNFEPLINLNANYEFKEIAPYDINS